MEPTRFEPTWGERLVRRIDVAMIFVALIAMASLILEFGGYLSPKHTVILQSIDVAIVLLFYVESIAKLFLVKSPLRYLREHVLHYVLLAALLAGLLLAGHLSQYPAVEAFLRGINIIGVTKLYIVIIQIAIVVRLMMHAVAAQKRLAHARFKPAQTLVASFLLIILVGTLLLYSPRAISEEHARRIGSDHIGMVDAIFTATSATCVTGLIVKDTGSDFSLFGQIVILVLIQIGGLGLMTFASFFALMLGAGMGVRDRLMMQDVLNQGTMGEVGKLIIYILLLTFAAEAVGAVMLYPVWDGDLSTSRRVYYSVFHSISCFCNAGFSLYRSSFMEYRSNAWLNFSACVLVILGGLGFAVHRNLIEVGRTAWRRLPLPFSRKGLQEPSRRIRMTLQTRVVLTMTAILIAAGALAVWLLERDSALREMSAKDQFLASTFQSVTARTAGFNTIDTSTLSTAGLVFVGVLMFIGASPGSTGGGIKTSTFAMLIFAIVSELRSRPHFEIFRRTIPRQLVGRAIVVVTVAMSAVVVSTILLCAFEPSAAAQEPDGVSLRQALFEVLSAFGTVGLSTGITPSLTLGGKIIIICTMLVGRIGPLTLVVAIGQRRARADYEYPEEDLLIG